MKNADPKVVGAIAVVVILLCGFFVMRSLGVGRDNTVPPIATGMPSDIGKKPGGAANIAIPGGAPGTAPGMGGGTALPTPGGTPGMGGTTLPTPGASGSGGGNMVPMPGAPK